MGGASTEIGETAEATIDVAARGGALGPGRRSPGRPAGTSCPARRPGASSGSSTRSCRRSPPSGPRGCSSSTAAARIAPGRTDEGAAPAPAPVRMPLELPDRVAGVAYERGATVRRLQQVGCRVEFDTGTDGHGVVVATPPSWRPDLVQAADLVEEVLRLEGYDTIPSVLPPAPPGRRADPRPGAAAPSRGRWPRPGTSRCSRSPFVGAAGLGRARPARRRRPPPDRARWPTRWTPTGPRWRRPCCRACSTPSCATAPAASATSCCMPSSRSCCRTRTRSRCRTRTSTDRPTDAEYAQIKAALPAQPVHVGVVLAGDRERARLVGTGTAGPLGGRDRDRPARGHRGAASSCG